MSKDSQPPPVIPSGRLLRLKTDKIKPSSGNPRHLFDAEPLQELKKNIREHGVLVPITVYQLKGQEKYGILDGERRYRCCVELKKEGIEFEIPANVVEPPSKIAGLLYMFSIHNFREQWELMPTALSLEIVMKDLGVAENNAISKLTGLSEAQIERCKKLLAFPKRFQNMSLDPDPKTRIPSNFWIEVYPILDLCESDLPKLVDKLNGRDGVTDKLVEKYRAKKIKSVIHFRRIMEAYEITNDVARDNVLRRLQEYILAVDLETRKAFDEFVVDNRRIQGAVGACDEFVKQLKRLKIDYALEREELRSSLFKVRDYVQKLIVKLEGTDAPEEEDEK